MAWYNPFSWRQNVLYEQVQGTHTYTLGSPDYGKFVSCFRGPYSDANVLTMFKTLPEVFAPIDGIARRVTAGKFVIRRISTDEIVYTKTRLNQLMEKPNPFQRWSDFIYNLVVYKYSGNRYVYTKIPKTLSATYENISSCWALPPQYTDIKLKSYHPDIFDMTSTSDLIDYYEVDWNGRSIKLTPNFVSHDSPLRIDEVDNGNPLKGISPIICDEYPMSNLCAVYEARNVIYVKRGPLGTIVSKKGDTSGLIPLTKTEKEQLINDMQASYGLSHGKSPYAITALPVEFIQHGASIKDLMPLEETTANAYTIASTLQYPKELLPSEKQSTYENQKNAEVGLYQNVIMREAKEICNILTDQWRLTQSGLYMDVTFDHLEILQEDKKLEAETFNLRSTSVLSLYNSGFITKNAGLVMLGQEEVEGFDVYSFDDPNRQQPINNNSNAANAPEN